MHLAPLIKDLAIILAVAGIMSFIFRKIRQPVVLGYILAGLVVGPHTPPFQLVKDVEGIQTWAELGVIFLMFSLGLEFSFRKLAKVGVTAFITATSEVIFFLIVGYFFGRLIGWTPIESFFLGAMLSISSTTIIIKALDELNLKNHRFAQLIFGVLIVEDLYAILLLVGLSTLGLNESISIISLSFSALKLLFVVGSWFITGYFIVPRIIKQAGKIGNPEMITIISIAFCLALVVFANYFEYSTALGAFIMGSILAETTLLEEIEERMEPLKDLFGAIFFVSIGMLIDPVILLENLNLILILCGVTIFGKIISTSFGSLASGQSVRDSLQVGMGLAQIGEFSFIMASLGLTLKTTGPQLYPIAVAVSLVTTFTTPFLIKYSANFSKTVEDNLPRKMKQMLTNYVLWINHSREGLKKHEHMGQVIFRWIINGMIVTLIFVTFRYVSSKFPTNFEFMAFGAAFVVSAPFLWAMLFGHKKFLDPNFTTDQKLPVFMSPLLTFAWVVTLCALYFPLYNVLPISAVIIAIFLGVTYRRLESSYQWFEENFLASFSDHKKKESEAFRHLAPWDAHLVTLKVHPNSKLVPSTLLEAQLRIKFGINIVAIKRGSRNIVAPHPSERILPYDDLVLLGNDQQVDQIRKELKDPEDLVQQFSTPQDYELRLINLENFPKLANHTIRQLGIREKYQSLIVGIERKGNRIINPDTDAEIQSQDKMWFVGERKNILRFIQDFS